MDRVYKGDLPRYRAMLEELQEAFAQTASKTDWVSLRLEPLLEHVKRLEERLQSPRFASETGRLRRGVVMFRSDLIYLRTNLKALKELLAVEHGRPKPTPRKPRGRTVRRR